MGQIGQILSHTASPPMAYAERLLSGIRAEDAPRFARPGGLQVISNHPTFVFGHLSLYPAKVLEHLRLPAGAAAIPAGWEAVFKAGVQCQDDPQQRIYPAFETVSQFFFASMKHALAALAEATDATLAAPNNAPEQRMRERFPMLGGMLGFYISGHTQMHLGQVSAWRRMMGLHPV
ncbi:MAG: DinB family protein [Phycisphaerae bacterium]